MAKCTQPAFAGGLSRMWESALLLLQYVRQFKVNFHNIHMYIDLLAGEPVAEVALCSAYTDTAHQHGIYYQSLRNLSCDENSL